MLRAFFTIINLFFISFLIAQDISSLSNELLELEQHIQYKQFNKDWKKSKKSWEEKCINSKSVTDLVKLMNQFAGVYAKSSNTPQFNFPDLEYYPLCNALINFKAQINENHLDFSEEEANKWEQKVKSLIDKEKARLEKEKNKRNQEFLESLMVRFEENYLKVFSGAQKGSFKEVRKETADKQVFDLLLDFKNAKESRIYVDEDDVYMFKLIFAAGDEQLAERIQEKIIGIINKHLPESYKRGKMFSGEFLTGFKITYDFQGQKFADTAKHPLIELGIDKANFDVILMITEPLFKR